jgi:ribonuclease HI
MRFGNSIFASIAENGVFISAENQTFPPPHQTTNFVLATDGSLSQNKNPITGGFAVCDSNENAFSTSHICDKSTSITTLELLALKMAFSLIVSSKETNCAVFFLIDSLSAIKLILGLDVREEDLEILRDIDTFRKETKNRNIQEVFVHVRSHRNTPVPLNSRADHIAGKFSQSTFKDRSKCEQSCRSIKCNACTWNETVNSFILDLNPTTKNVFITHPRQ